MNTFKTHNRELFISGFEQNVQELAAVLKRQSAHQIVEEKEMKRFSFELSCYHSETVVKLAEHYNSSLINGMSEEVAVKRLRFHSMNELDTDKNQKPSFWIKCLHPFVSGFTVILWVGTIIVFTTWAILPTSYYKLYYLIIGVLLLALIVVSSAVSFWKDLQTHDVIAKYKINDPKFCLVVRDGLRKRLPVTHLVVGDLVLINAVSLVPADIRVATSVDMKVDKSALTGESTLLSVTAEPEPPGMSYLVSKNTLFRGTKVVEGSGTGIVIATGKSTQISKTMNQLQETKPRSGMYHSQQEFINVIAVIGMITVCTTVAAAVSWVFYYRNRRPFYQRPGSIMMDILRILLAFVPMTLPLIINVGLAKTAHQLYSKYNVLVKELNTSITLGMLSLFAFDKTGFLTHNQVSVTGILWKNSTTTSFDSPLSLNDIVPVTVKNVASRIVLLTSTKDQHEDEQMIMEVLADVDPELGSTSASPTSFQSVEQCLFVWARTQRVRGVTADELTTVTTLQLEQICGVVARDAQSNEVFVMIRGDAENVLSLCSSVMDESGHHVPIDDKSRLALSTRIDAHATLGCTVIGLALIGPLPTAQYPLDFEYVAEPVPNFPVEGFTFVAGLALSDPLRDGVRDAITQLKSAGLRLSLIMGDSESTAIATARQIGLVSDNGRVHTLRELQRMQRQVSSTVDAIIVTGKDVDSMSPKKWEYVLGYPAVIFALTSSEQKLAIVNRCQERGFMVGVTGDGVKDSPALRKADIGIASSAGTDVAKNVASVVLLSDNVNAVCNGIAEGRRLFDNMKKTIVFLLTGSSWAIGVSVLLSFFLASPTPIWTLPIILTNCTSDLFCGLCLLCEPGESDLMTRPPLSVKRASLMDCKILLYACLFYGNMMLVGAYYNFFAYMASRGNTHAVPDPIPVELKDIGLPAGYRFDQLVFAWNWAADLEAPMGQDQLKAWTTGSSVFFMTIIVAQLGQLLSIRRRLSYFYQCVVGHNRCVGFQDFTHNVVGSVGIVWPVLCAMVCSISAVCFFLYVPVVSTYCGFAPIGARWWGLAFAWSVLWFALAEARKWIIVLYPESWIARLAWEN